MLDCLKAEVVTSGVGKPFVFVAAVACNLAVFSYCPLSFGQYISLNALCEGRGKGGPVLV